MSVLGIDSNTEILNIGQIGILEFQKVSGVDLPAMVKSRIAGMTEWTTAALKNIFTSVYNVCTFQCAIADTPWMMTRVMGPSGPQLFPPAQVFFLKAELASGDSIYGLFRYAGHPITVTSDKDFFRKEWTEIPYNFFDPTMWAPCTFHEISIYTPENVAETIRRIIREKHLCSERLRQQGYL